MSLSDTVGVALAGGASRRMGRDKAGLRLGGRTLLESAVIRLAEVCAEVLVADRGRGSMPAGLAEPILAVADGHGHGPAAGILGAAAARPERPLLVLACDLPRIPSALLAALAAAPGDAVIPIRGGRLEPLCALYRPPALAALAAQVERGVDAVHRLTEVDSLDLILLDEAALAPFGDPDEIFLNVNTPEDLARIGFDEGRADG